ncbi:MAG: DNA-binding protein [Arachnia sp.]
MDDGVAVEANRAEQARLYGQPLNQLLGQRAALLGINQAALAGLLGISAPMLSQLMHARRIKIANPAAAQRLRFLIDITDRIDSGDLTQTRALELLHEAAEVRAPATASGHSAPRDKAVSAGIQEVFRQVASARDFLGAADLVEQDYPAIAELLRVYGTERADVAQAFTQTRI